MRGEGLPGEARSPWASYFRPGEAGPTPSQPARAGRLPAPPPHQVKRGPGCAGARCAAASLRLAAGPGQLFLRRPQPASPAPARPPPAPWEEVDAEMEGAAGCGAGPAEGAGRGPPEAGPGYPSRSPPLGVVLAGGHRRGAASRRQALPALISRFNFCSGRGRDQILHPDRCLRVAPRAGRSHASTRDSERCEQVSRGATWLPSPMRAPGGHVAEFPGRRGQAWALLASLSK